MKYIGYHTTNKKNGKNILKTKTFKCSTSDYEWLGHGIYFWHNKYTAKNFWTKTKNIPLDETLIISAELIADTNNILDLDDEEQLLEFLEFCKSLKAELIASKQFIPLSNNIEKQCFYSNYFKEKYDIAIIKRTFEHKNKEVFKVNRLQYCVSDSFKDRVIQNIEEVV